MKRSAHTYSMILCAARLSEARLSATIIVSYLACVKINVETHDMIQNSGLVSSMDREKPHRPITFSFVVRICSELSDQN